MEKAIEAAELPALTDICAAWLRWPQHNRRSDAGDGHYFGDGWRDCMPCAVWMLREHVHEAAAREAPPEAERAARETERLSPVQQRLCEDLDRVIDILDPPPEETAKQAERERLREETEAWLSSATVQHQRAIERVEPKYWAPEVQAIDLLRRWRALTPGAAHPPFAVPASLEGIDPVMFPRGATTERDSKLAPASPAASVDVEAAALHDDAAALSVSEYAVTVPRPWFNRVMGYLVQRRAHHPQAREQAEAIVREWHGHESSSTFTTSYYAPLIDAIAAALTAEQQKRRALEDAVLGLSNSANDMTALDALAQLIRAEQGGI